MKKWFQNLKEKLNDRIERSYGFDEMNVELIVAGVFFVLLDLYPKFDYISIWGLFFLFWGCFRCYSTNIERRQKELQVYISLKTAATEWVSETLCKIREWILYRRVRCPHCGTVIKVPRKLGTVNIRCPRCGRHFIK